MPIRPEHISPYPIDWPQLSHRVRFVRAGGACEHCGAPHGQMVFHLQDGRWWDRKRHCWRNGRGGRVRRPMENILAYGAWIPVVLACAHLNHDGNHLDAEPLDRGEVVHHVAGNRSLP